MPNQKPLALEVVADNENVISINNRKKLDDLKEQFPNMEIIVGNKDLLPEKSVPVSLDLAQMESSKAKIFDAATENVLGGRVNRLEKPIKFPFALVMGIVGFLLGVATTFYVYTI